MEFEDIYLQYKDDVHRFVSKLCDYQEAMADDITQETFLKAYINISTFQGKSSVKTWLFTIAKNTFLSEIRKKKYDDVFVGDLTLFEHNHDDNFDVMAKKELLEITLSLIFELPHNMQEVFLARIYSEDSYEKIASDLGISTSSAKVLVFRARKKIKNKLKEEYGYDL
ncbi:RNA polymerase sigma factor [Peptoniphilus equinus]|uniref:RNA polymerase sigma factor n=1 Tax=Peptoniphilus equinus TaxID=3016343 RepID=A0ABY7QTA0_9FIRM|nr:RNA polymerase sigma factor [Peptoniphilus equinus]WBW49373.1 RNA polymerase sigma factor [Peptoniphilus equinus]